MSGVHVSRIAYSQFGKQGGFFMPIMRTYCLIICVVCFGLAAQPAHPQTSSSRLMNLSLTELMDIEVTSVTKTSQRLFASSASIYVLTNEDIERSGVASLPDALRLIPGVEVSRVDANKYAVSIRGFSSLAANKLLVLIDGRPVYDPLFAGVFWESREVDLETIDHIEVVRGPGGAVWGANAVNGVINIVTKSAQESERVRVTGAGGSRPRGSGYAHFGQHMRNTAYRVSASIKDNDHGYAANDAFDTRQSVSANFRLDNTQSVRDQLTFLAGYFDVDAGQGTTEPTKFMAAHTGANASAFWTRTLNSTDKLTSQLIVDYFKLDYSVLREERHLAQLELRHELHPHSRHQILWGGTYEYRRDFVETKSTSYVDPSGSTGAVYSVFGQDQVDIVKRKLTATIGSKVEHNVYTGFEVQPSVSLGWLAHDRNYIWGAVSRSVRTPSRLEADIAAGGVRYGDKFKSENLTGYQIGNRLNLNDEVSFDVTGFVHDYDGLITGELDGYHNDMYGQSYGLEAASHWQATEDLKLQAGYALVRMQLDIREGSHPANTRNVDLFENIDPRNTATLRAMFNATRDIELDAALRYVDHLRNGIVPSYLVGDLRIGWRPTAAVTVSVAARDLFNPHHFEQVGVYTTEVEPTLYGKVTFAVK